jgi:ribonuclease-3
MPDADRLAKIQNILDHSFSDTSLLRSALTHGSRNQNTPDYERLEFLGDRVLNLVIAEELFRRFPDEQEGALAARLSLLVRAEACAQVGAKMGLAAHINVGKVEKQKGVHQMASVLGDAVEALIAAHYIDGGLAAARGFILAQWADLLAAAPGSLKDPKTFVQEWALGQALPLPNYSVQQQEGPDHAPVFTISLQVGRFAPVMGLGRSKQLAEMEAARAFIAREGLR